LRSCCSTRYPCFASSANWKGVDKNRHLSAQILFTICDRFPEKSPYHYNLLEHLLFSCQFNSISAFKVSAASIVRAEFQTGLQVEIFMKKAISSQSSLKTYDVCLQPHSLIS
jgi:hypothetical protein